MKASAALKFSKAAWNHSKKSYAIRELELLLDQIEFAARQGDFWISIDEDLLTEEVNLAKLRKLGYVIERRQSTPVSKPYYRIIWGEKE